MTIQIALHHQTKYTYDRPINLGPQVVRLRPAPHCRTPILSYSLKILPENHFLNWQQDPHGNYLARLVFLEKTREFCVDVDVIAEMTVINPFDFFIEDSAEEYPFAYEEDLIYDLRPFLRTEAWGPKFQEYLNAVDKTPRRTIFFLVDLNQKLQKDIGYLIRMEPGVQSPEETLAKRSGSCRDSSWLLVQLCRHLGIAARFVSGYLVQLTADVKSLDGPSGPENDFTDLHAWVEVYLPGAGWVGLDPTSGLFASEGHIPLACTPHPMTAAPIAGGVEKCETEFHFEMSIKRFHEDPRVTKPYTEDQWEKIQAVGHAVDERLKAGDVRLTMGGEPTFVSIDDMDGEEWNIAAVGPTKKLLASNLLFRLADRFAPGGLLHYGQGKWYPGESLPRWALSCFWRTDGEPLWNNFDLIAKEEVEYKHTPDDAHTFTRQLASELDVDPKWIVTAYEDVWHFLQEEQRLPVHVDPSQWDLKDGEERRRLAHVIERGMDTPVGCMLPIRHQWWQAKPRWISGPWPIRSEKLFLIPGDSPMGLRLPLDHLFKSSGEDRPWFFDRDPFAPRLELPSRAELANSLTPETRPVGQLRKAKPEESASETSEEDRDYGPGDMVRTALCVEPRNGRLHVFMPPVERLEDYLHLIAKIEQAAEALEMPVVIEGYMPPKDERLQLIKVTPDPGVIEVNVQPAGNWKELVAITTGIYEDAHYSRLGTEKFQLDGRHTGTGGGNHLVLGGRTPADSPFLRRPDLLRSLIAYWVNHPSLSYVFSGMFIGPTSQAPRVDEGRRDAVYELKIAMEQIPEHGPVPPWLVDRIFRHLLVDLTGNTHRAEFCIDKLYSPDSSTGRLGLVEFRAFEMPPHARMSLTQQLLVRAMVARFWEQPYREELINWGTSLHDKFMLPHFLMEDFRDVLGGIRSAGFDFDLAWFLPHFEFRCPVIGKMNEKGMDLTLRQAVEPWYVLGEEPAGGATARFVDSSVERLEVKIQGLNSERYSILCNGREVPLAPTGIEGEYVAGVRYRAWQPPSCLHPTIPMDTPLTFDLVDRWNHRSVGGCKYHIDHPGGLNPAQFPVNALEAESRRASRFFKMGHTGGTVQVSSEPVNPEFPLTLDLRRHRHHL